MIGVAARLLSELERHQVQVLLEGERLSIRGRGRALPLLLRAELREHRADLVAALRADAERLPLLALYSDASGARWESWLLLADASDLVEELARLGARVHQVAPWVRADLPQGAAPPDLVAELLERHRGRLRCPTLAELEERLVPAGHRRIPEPEPSPRAPPVPTLPDACPACRSPRPEWAALTVPGRFLCRRCWTAAP